MRSVGYRLRASFLIIAVVFLLGTLGYHGIEGWSYFDSLYMTVITVSTVGYNEVEHLSPGGRWLTLGIILVGVSGVAYGVSGLMEDLVENRIRRLLGRRRLEKRIGTLAQHIIICGYGRTGEMVCKDLAGMHQAFVAIEAETRRTARAEEAQHLYILGDARDEAVLKAAGIERARGLLAVLNNDAENLLVTLTARGLNENLVVVSRCVGPDKEKSFLRAGATKVILPKVIGARRATTLLTKPHVMDFIDVVTRHDNLELVIDEVEISPVSPFAGRSLRESELRKQTGLIVLAIKKPGGEMVFNPPPESVVSAGDRLVTVGRQEGRHILHERP